MRNHQFRLLAVVILLALGCSEPPAAPVPGAASVQIVSAVDTILALSRTAQLTATAKDATGNSVSAATFTWTTSNAAVVTVSAAGLVQPVASGAATVTAATTGASGSIRLLVVPADLTLVAAVAADPFATALLAALSTATRTAAQTAWAKCGTGASAGKVVDIVAWVDAVRTSAASAADATDKVLLAVLQFYVDQVRLKLGF
jgi:hypothetical protein